MDIKLLSENEKQTFKNAVASGLYPYEIKGGGFCFMIDKEGKWFGTNKPSQSVKEEVDEMITSF